MSRIPFPVGLDTNTLIYLIEGESDERQRFLEAELYQPLLRGDGAAVASTLAITEFLARPWRILPREEVLAQQNLLVEVPNLHFVTVDVETAFLAAEVRGRSSLTLADAIHVATAIVSGAEAFLTNDSRVARAGLPISVLRLDDLVAG